MICPVVVAHEMSALRAVKVADHRGYGLLLKDHIERTLKVQEVSLRILVKNITWWRAARPWHQRLSRCGVSKSARKSFEGWIVRLSARIALVQASSLVTVEQVLVVSGAVI